MLPGADRKYVQYGCNAQLNPADGKYHAVEQMDEESVVSYHYSLEVWVYEGDVLSLTLPESFDGEVLLGQQPQTLTDGVFTYTAGREDWISFMITDDADFTVDAKIEGTRHYYAPLEGETSKTLSKVELGTYECHVTYGTEGEENWEDFYVMLEANLQITKQPSENDPTVTVNFPNDVTYQWYQNVQKTGENAPLVPISSGVEGAVVDCTPCKFDPATKLFSTENGIPMRLSMNVAANSVITLTVPNDNDELNIWANAYIEGSDGVYTIVCDYDQVVEIEFVPGMNYGVQFKAELSGGWTMPVAVEDQTAAKLTPSSAGEYFCRVTASDSQWVESEPVDLSYRITHEPTVNDPTVTVSWAEQVEKYEWFLTTSEMKKLPVVPDMGVSVYGEYDENTGKWSSVPGDEFNSSYGLRNMMMFSCQAFLGFGLYLDIPENVTVYGIYSENADGSFGPYLIPYGGIGCVVVLESAAPFSLAAQVTAYEDSSEKVEGQNTATLDAKVPGLYHCKVTYKDGTVLQTQYGLDLSYQFTKEPTEKDPTVEVNWKELLKGYQWFLMQEEVKTEPVSNNLVMMPCGRYENGVWNSVQLNESEVDPANPEYTHAAGFVLVPTPGDTVKLNLPANLEYQLAGGGYEEQEDGTLLVTDNDCMVVVAAKTAFTMTAEFKHTVLAMEKVEGQTTATLSPAVPGYYYCEATYQDGTQIQGGYLSLFQEIVTQPTDDSPIVEMRWPELVKNYQWFQVSYHDKKVTDTAEETDTEYPAQAQDAVYSNGKWYVSEGSSDYVYFLSMEIQKNEIFYVNLVGPTALWYLDVTGYATVERMEDGSYVIRGEHDGDFTIYVIYEGMPKAGEDGIEVI